MDILKKAINLKDVSIINSNNDKQNLFDSKFYPKINNNNFKNCKIENTNIKSTENAIIIKKKSQIINDDGIFLYYKRKYKKITLLSRKHNIFERINNLMEEENASFSYRKIIIKYFSGLIEYIINKKNKKRKIKINKEDINSKINNYKNKINISDVSSFVKYKYKNYKVSTKKIILSKIRKYVRILNNHPKLDFKFKISFSNTKKKKCLLTELELASLINTIKLNNEIQILIIFYLLYYSGLTFYLISIIKYSDFKQDFSILKLIKGKTRLINIPSIIKENIKFFLETIEHSSVFFFYSSFKGNNNQSRTQLIRKKIEDAIWFCKEISLQKKKALINEFSKSRKYKILSEKFFTLFDYNIIKFDDKHIPKLFDSSDLKKKSLSSSKSLKNNSLKISEKRHVEDSKNNSDFIPDEKKSDLKFIYNFSKSESFLEERSCNRFFIKRYNDLKCNKRYFGEKNYLVSSDSLN